MHSRRQALKAGLGLFAYAAADSALTRTIARASPPMSRLSGIPDKSSRPLAARQPDPNPRIIDGLRFKNWFEGDDFNDGLNIPFHSAENNFPGGVPPEPDEFVPVAIVGGGISGLASAHLLRRYNPVVFELHSIFGGNAQGGVINGAEYPLGSAYVITPDPGSALDHFYRELGLHHVVRPDIAAAPVEMDGLILDDVWSGMGVPPEDVPAFEAYRQLVLRMADNYPDVPFPEAWMRDLDRLSLRQHIEQEVALPIPAPLAAAVQAYCYSSFGAGWEEISALLGWNFLAAEEFGRWVFPGGNAWMADALWQRISRLDSTDPGHAPHLRAAWRVVDVRVLPDRTVQVTWRTPEGRFGSMIAQRVVMACPKHVCRHVIHDLERIDATRYNAMNLHRRAYVVANVFLDRPVPRDFYDIFLLGHPQSFPMDSGQATNFWRYTDVLNGSYASRRNGLPAPPHVLTLYWPLAYDSARFDLVMGDPILAFGQALAAQLNETLALLDLPRSAVQEVRFTRFGHALPVAQVGFVANGIAHAIRRPFQDRVYFVNQDNWALPAVENSLYDAFEAADAIAAALG
ncbi:MAG: NAD(P)-binding protein [Phycisphaerales bacterium]|nr:NAD(P)-binding protein [Phycisphaerales bacterium]